MNFFYGFIGFLIGNVTGAIGGVVCYWYFAIHRGKIPQLPKDVK